ncbi:MAG: glycosyltransferase family 2 protein [Deltaproteobacteria bacterium]|nr:glycosyltransferase family 2 protein [Deltaproteobacteria bacterium]
MRTLFWLSIWTTAYTWFGYFLLLRLFKGTKYQETISPAYVQDVTLVIAAFNEEKVIQTKLDNLLGQTYGKSRFDILVASDGSTDRTDEIVEAASKEDDRISLFKAEGLGKSATQNAAIPVAKGDIIVLTDAETRFAPDAMKNLVRRFSDPGVGCVSGRLVPGSIEGSVAESQGLYWRFEMALRRMESAIGLLHTATGGIMAFRKELFRPFDPKYGDDCMIPLDIAEKGYRIVHEDKALAYDSFPSSIGGELRARTRMTLRNLTCTLSKHRLLNPFKHPGLCWAMVSHKLLRWLTPFFLLIAFISNVILFNEGSLYFFTGFAQLAFYFFGLVGLFGEMLKLKIPIASQIFSFLLANAGFLMGVLKAVCGRHITAYRNAKPCHGS